MRYAIFSDIHANLQAWRAIHRDIVRLEADVLVCLGDVVGYGPKPEEVLTAIREATPNFVMGNHDAAAVGIMDSGLFNRNAETAIKWTRRQLSPESKRFLRKRPLTIVEDQLLFVHAEISEPGMFRYIESEEDARENLADCDQFITFVGHTHRPRIFDLDEDGKVDALPDTDCQLDESHRYIVNVGSVGEPRDPEDIRAHYVIYDSDTRDLYFRRVEFDTEAYREELAGTSLQTKPYFLQLADHHAALEAEIAHAMMADMRPPEGSEEYFEQFRKKGTTEKLQLSSTVAAGSGAKPKPRPSSTKRDPRRLLLFIGLVVSLLLSIAALKQFWPAAPTRPSGALSDASPQPAQNSRQPSDAEPAVLPDPPAPLIAKVDPPPSPIPSPDTEPVPAPLPSIPEPEPTPVPEPPLPEPVPEPDPAPPAPKVLAYWRFEEEADRASPTDEVEAHPLLTLKAGRRIVALAPDPIPLTGERNDGALATGFLREMKASGSFELAPDRSLTLEGWLMTSGARQTVSVVSTRTGESPGWQIDVRTAKDANSRGSIRFVHQTAAGQTTVQADDIDLFSPAPHHFALVWDYSAGGDEYGILGLYYDGIRVAEGEIAHDRLRTKAGTPGMFHIGGESNPQGFALDELRFSAAALEPAQFLDLGRGRLANRSVALMIDVGPAGNLYSGGNSPAHAEGAVAKEHNRWSLATPDKIENPTPQVVLANGEPYGIPISIEVGEVGPQLSGEPFVSMLPLGGGPIFGSDLLDCAVASEGASSAAIRVRGLEAGDYTVYFTPALTGRLGDEVEFGLGVDLAGDTEVVSSIFDRGMNRWHYQPDQASPGDKRWVNGRNYFRQNVRITHPEDCVVAIVHSGEEGSPATIPYLQLVKIGDSKLHIDPVIEFRFEGEEPINDGPLGSELITNIKPMFAEGFIEPVKMVPRPSGGMAAAGDLDSPSKRAKDYFGFEFDVIGKGAILSGFSFEVGGQPTVFCEVSLHDETGRQVAVLCQNDAVRPVLIWRGCGTLAGMDSLGIRLAPDTYTLRISGSDTDGRKQLQIDNVKVDFEEL